MVQYKCNTCRTVYSITDKLMKCSCDRSIEVISIEGFQVPIFKIQEIGRNEFSIDNAGEIHDNAMQWLHDVHNTNEESFRNLLMDRLPNQISSNPKILITSVGAGNDLPYILKKFPNAELYIQDIAYQMLESAISRHSTILAKANVNIFLGDAAILPFGDNVFDIVYHFGGLNLFDNLEGAIMEAYRVLKVNGDLLMGDEGIAPWMYKDIISEILIKNNPLYTSKAPIELLPIGIKDFKLEYLFNNCFYLITFKKSDYPEIDLDVAHKGRRGGSLRTRYYGQLEGVSPDIKERLNLKALEMGLSRVELLEMLLENGLQDDGR